MIEYKFSDFGMRLKDLREQKGIKQGQLADILQISRQSMSNYESGKHSPDIDVIIKMATYFECSTDYLFGLTDHPARDMQKDYGEDMELLSETISSIPWSRRGEWIELFTAVARCVQQSLSKRVGGDFVKPDCFRLLVSLWNTLIGVADKQRKREYTAKEKRAANYGLRWNLRRLSDEVQELDDMGYQLINPAIDDGDSNSDNTNNTITQENEG